jgi:hypothetical protein
MNDSSEKIKLITDLYQRNAIKSLMDLISGEFGFNFSVNNGNVVEIQMVACGLTKVPSILGAFNQLQILFLQSNKIKAMKNLQKLIHLRSLNLSDNHIENITEIGILKSLEEIDLSINQIKMIPALTQLNRLKKLNLSGNPIQKLRNLHVLESLTELGIERLPLNPEEKEIGKKGITAIKDYCRTKATDD